MREPDAIVAAVRAALAVDAGGTPPAKDAPERPPGAAADAAGLTGRTVLVSAAGTREAIDPVRFVGNRSSGKMGYALAAAAAARGARVLLVSGPTHLEAPAGVAEIVRVETADEMLAALAERVGAADVLLMAAAVADYRPRDPAAAKLKRGSGPLRLDLEPTPDLLAALAPRKGERLFVGFALETGDLEAEAQAKLRRKGLDLIVANRVGPGTGFDSDTNQVWIYDAGGLVIETPRVDKHEIATAILDVVETRLGRAEVHGRER
jgi:phosphopantothenoylcysteine decarboxylase/phosphopantothenate--cysteine ligase